MNRQPSPLPNTEKGMLSRVFWKMSYIRELKNYWHKSDKTAKPSYWPHPNRKYSPDAFWIILKQLFFFRRRKWPGWFASYQNGCNQLYIRGKQYNEPRFSRHDRRQETRYHRCQKHRYRFYRRFIRIRRLQRTIGSRSGLHSRRYSGTPQITSVVLHYSSDFIHVFGVFLLLLHMKESNLGFAL